MYALRKTVVETLLLACIGVALGFGANAVRSKGSIRVNKNYFDRGGQPTTTITVATGLPSVSTPATNDSTQSADPASDAKVEHVEHPPHPYQEISFSEVAEMFGSDDHEMGLYVFVDARGDDAFAEGHIPGSLQFSPYEVDRFLEPVFEMTQAALKVIVYCNGGDCEDSIFTCRELVSAGQTMDSVYLFAGGWEDWTANDMPVERGSEE